ncbi:MAG: winged helix-turn-helix domain-containing protein [Burkholderiaceae bacterium]|nr:winged helix-turn-helix domain-containing protein [Microbacteriaceae bacterium]
MAEQRVAHQNQLDVVLFALTDTVVAAAVGHVTAAPLVAADITPIVPERYRMGALIPLVCEHLEDSRVARLRTVHGALELRGKLVRLDGEQAALAPTSLTLLRALMAADGNVVARTDLPATMREVQDDHALDVAISRLRQALPVAALVATVIKRGYRIDV